MKPETIELYGIHVRNKRWKPSTEPVVDLGDLTGAQLPEENAIDPIRRAVVGLRPGPVRLEPVARRS